jgi:hypothetical protein
MNHKEALLVTAKFSFKSVFLEAVDLLKRV